MIFKMTKDPDVFMESEQGRKMLENLREDEAKLFLNSDFRDVFFQSSVETYRQGSDSIRAMIQEVKLMKKRMGCRFVPDSLRTSLYLAWHRGQECSSQ